MPKFVQLHLLTSYPPANLNRDDLGRPKTAMMGGANRLRVSSQSLKRAWRTSENFQQSLSNHVGTRTKRMGKAVYDALLDKGVDEKQAMEWAKSIAKVFGKEKKARKEDSKLVELEIEQLAHFSPEECDAISALVTQLAESSTGPTDEQLALLRETNCAADIALFGRMLASSPAYNIEAAAQVAHAISVHRVEVEDDYFTAVDDLNDGPEAAHISETEFAAGLFYLYICIDTELLLENLSDDHALTLQTIKALIECAATVAPTGKQNSFASRARASYILCECGNQQPRSLSVAFLKPVTGHDMLATAISALETTRAKMDEAYGDGSQRSACMNVESGQGSLTEIMDCVSKP